MLKVAIDGGPLSGGDSVRGIGVYARELINALEKLENTEDRKLKVNVIDVSKEDLSKYNVVHFTRFNPFSVSFPFTKPKNTKFVLTVYDLIPLIYPKHYPPGAKGKIRFLINKYLIRKNIDAIITISETSKKDICRFLEVDPHKVFVTYLAARSTFKRMKITEKWRDSWLLEPGNGKIFPKKFALYVGDINYNKNIPNLVAACKLAKIPLVIAGKQAYNIEKMNLDHPELIHLKGVDWSNVIMTGFVPDETLVELYNLASVYIQASFYEGFGLPLLEAVECGTPIVVAKNQCHVEILGNDFKFVDPKNVNEMSKAVLYPNVNRKLPRTYSWENTAKDTLNVYEKV
jgi:glycosyltransferase involved in cell wall biosynthesis